MSEDKAVLGVIGGSGIYEIDGIKNIREVDVDTPFGSPSDNIIVGELEGIKVAFLPRHGRGHYISPSGINFRANIFALKKLGAQIIVSASAVGSMREEIEPGDIVVADQFFDRTKDRPLSFFGNGMVTHISFSEPICALTADELVKAAEEEGAKVHKKGTYLCMEGPQFSTKGESRIYRSWGIDVIGMTALPEAKLAREAEMCYVTMALVTDYDCWHPDHEAVTVDAVVRQMFENSDRAKRIIARLIPGLAQKDYSNCKCRSALKNSIMTSPDKIDPEMKKELELLVGKYLN